MVSILVTFDDTEQLTEMYTKCIAEGWICVDGEYELGIGDTCEAILVHPETGESLELKAEVQDIEPESVVLRFGASPLVRNQLLKFAGVDDTAANVNARMRAMNANERRQVARGGELAERVALERAFGKEVWEPLLGNPKLTVGEVVRLSRMGTMPLPYLEKIVANNAWVKVPQIRRALLSNRRLDGAMIQRIIKMTPPAELKLIPKQTVYPQQVRAAAKRALKKPRYY